MSVINPTGNTGGRDVPNLATATAPELYDLQRRMIEKDDRLQDLGEQFNSRLMSLFQRDPFNGDGEFKTITELTLETYGYRQREGTSPKTTRFGIGRTFNFSYDDYGVAYVATERSLMNANRHRNVIQNMMNLTRMLFERRYLDGVLRLSYGTASSYVDRDGETVDTTGIDGLSIFNSAHTLPHSSTTFSNIIPSNPSLSKGGILAAENMFKTEVFDGYGAQKRIVPNTLVITDDSTLVYNATQIYGSSTELGQDNPNVINALPSRRIVILPGLDSDANGDYDAAKKDKWILGRFGTDGVDARYCERYGIKTVPTVVDDQEMTRNAKWGAKAGYRFVIISGIGMVQSDSSGT